MKNEKPFKVKIEWEHGDADLKAKTSYGFATESEMVAFLQFIYEVRRFVPNKGYGKTGYFSDSHYEREAAWVEEVANKHNPDFLNYMEMDRYYDRGDYYAVVDNIYVKIDGVKHHILWGTAAETNLFELPKKGDMIDTTTGNISNCGAVFGDKNGYLDYHQLKEIYNQVGEEYAPMNVKVLDVKLDYDKKRYTDFTSFHYIFSCEIPAGKVTTRRYGFDPTYEEKFGKEAYDGMKMYRVN